MKLDHLPVGCQIRHCGVEMTVVGHDYWGGDNRFPGLVCNYMDNSGIVQQHLFAMNELEYIKNVLRAL
jgi:hypothetical protein